MEPILELFFLNLSQSFFKPLRGKGKGFLLAKLCCSRRARSFHSGIVKNFPVCPLQCGCQPTNQRHSAARQRGSDANLGATGNHYWHQTQCLPFFFPLAWHFTNKMAVLVATKQPKRSLWINSTKWFYGLKYSYSQISYQILGKVGTNNFINNNI